MKASTANFLNALVLIGAGLYGYFIVPADQGVQSPTALIPAAFGIIFMILQKGVISGNKAVSHIVVVLTLVLLAMCIWRFTLVEEWNAKKYIFLICAVSCAIAMAAFINSFITVRRNKSVNGKEA